MIQNRVILDRLYGPLPYSEDDLRLFQTPELTRLRQVSLSAVPPWVIPTGVCASKFEHTVGVGYLARIVGQRREFRDIARDLYFAALAHDLGTPPFSHLSEHFQRRIIWKDHEQFVEDVLAGSEFASEVTRQGGSLENVVKLIKRELAPWSDLINGSIDIDNLDNTLRYGMSMGVLPSDALPYSPVRLASSFRFHDGHVCLEQSCASQLKGWSRCREVVYDYVLSPTNLSPGMMLYRALYFAEQEGELSADYFRMTDAEAFQYLLKQCNARTHVLIERAKCWQFYDPVLTFRTAAPSSRLREFIESVHTRSVLADRISETCRIPLEDVCVYTGKSRGARLIHLPLVDDQGAFTDSGIKEPPPTWTIQAYLNPDCTVAREAIEAYVQQEIEALS